MHSYKHALTQPQGAEYFKTEKARLDRMISSGGVAAAKVSKWAPPSQG